MTDHSLHRILSATSNYVDYGVSSPSSQEDLVFRQVSYKSYSEVLWRAHKSCSINQAATFTALIHNSPDFRPILPRINRVAFPFLSNKAVIGIYRIYWYNRVLLGLIG
jgi:hypothetical protein